MDANTISLELSQYATSLLKYFGVGQKSPVVAERVVAVANEVAQTEGDGAKALELIRLDPVLQMEFRKRILELDSEFEGYFLTDLSNARARDLAIMEAGHRNYRADFLSILAVIVVIIVVVQIWTKVDLDDFQKATITLILGRFLGYIDQMFQFEFGSTRSSKAKDDTIVHLSQK